LRFQIWAILGFCCVLKSQICFSKNANLRFEKTNSKYLKNKFQKTQISNTKDKFHKTQREGKRVKSTILKNKFVFVENTNLYFFEMQICVSKHKYVQGKIIALCIFVFRNNKFVFQNANV